MWPRPQCVVLLSLAIAVFFQAATTDHDGNDAVYSNELNVSNVPCRQVVPIMCDSTCKGANLFYSMCVLVLILS